jgi:hypothetical protein
LFLVANLAISYFNKPLYLLLDRPNKHFAYKYHIAKDLANILKDKNITSVKSIDKQLALRLKFYGIKDGGDYILSHSKFKKDEYKTINIEYLGKLVKRFYLYK